MLVIIAVFGCNSTMCDDLSAGVHVKQLWRSSTNQACVLLMTFYDYSVNVRPGTKTDSFLRNISCVTVCESDATGSESLWMQSMCGWNYRCEL